MNKIIENFCWISWANDKCESHYVTDFIETFWCNEKKRELIDGMRKRLK